MKLIFGLGNPEPEYSNTRHNIGKDVLNAYAEECLSDPIWKYKPAWKARYLDLSDHNMLIKPAIYMNESGEAISKIANFYKVEPYDILIIYDELDLTVGEYKLAQGKGSKIHNGIASINQELGKENYWHLRIGVREEGIPGSVQKTGRDPAKYVLSQFNASDKKKISELMNNSLITELNSWLSKK